jgi:RHS repeat-associated protein
MRSCTRYAPVLMLGVLAMPALARAQTPPETIEYYATDTIGSVRIVFGANGTALGRHDYAPFGRPIVPVPTMPAEGFGGNVKDDETDLSYFHARMFQARTGRFTRPDPIQGDVFVPQRRNRYAYALNSPADTTDAFGLDPCSPGVNFCATSVPACTAFGCSTGDVGSQSHNGIIFVDFWKNNYWNLVGYGSGHPGPTNGSRTGTGTGTGTSTPQPPPNSPPTPPALNAQCDARTRIAVLPSLMQESKGSSKA